jgi:Iap family predicted aminopeptidase
VGMINFDMFASVDPLVINMRNIVTADGLPNYLTEMFPEFTLSSEKGSDHTAFYAQAIYSMSFSDLRDSYYHTPRDTIDAICRDKLFFVVERASKVIARFMCGSTGSFAYIYDSEIGKDTVVCMIEL